MVDGSLGEAIRGTTVTETLARGVNAATAPTASVDSVAVARESECVQLRTLAARAPDRNQFEHLTDLLGDADRRGVVLHAVPKAKLGRREFRRVLDAGSAIAAADVAPVSGEPVANTKSGQKKRKLRDCLTEKTAVGREQLLLIVAGADPHQPNQRTL